MGVIVTNMTIPDSCAGCPSFVEENRTCRRGCFIPFGFTETEGAKHKDCPVKSVEGLIEYMVENSSLSAGNAWSVIKAIKEYCGEGVATADPEQMATAIKKYTRKRDVEVIIVGAAKGEWVINKNLNGRIQCSKCYSFSGLTEEDVAEGYELSNYCSNCGVDMRESAKAFKEIYSRKGESDNE